MRINLSKTPSFPQTYHTEFPNLDGGLNLRDLGYLVASNESPCMKNLVWRNGILQSRDGQKKVAQINRFQDVHATGSAECYAAYMDLFHGYAFFHVGNAIQCLDMSSLSDGEIPYCGVVPSPSYINPGRGNFFPYGDKLYYKNEGAFYAISYTTSPRPSVPKTGQQYLFCTGGEEQTYSVFAYDSSVNKYVRAESLTGVADETPVVLRNNSSGMVLVAGPAPMEGAASYSKYFIADGVDEVGLDDVVGYAEFTLVRDPSDLVDPNTQVPSFSRSVFWLTRQGTIGTDMFTLHDLLLCANESGRSASLRELPLDDRSVYYEAIKYGAWYAVPDEDDASQFRLANYAVSEVMGAEYSVNYIMPTSTAAVPFECVSITDIAGEAGNAPVIVINASPETGSGTMYQPENRLSSKKTVWYNGDGTHTVYKLPVSNIDAIIGVEVDGTTGIGFGVDYEAGTVTFISPPAAGTNNVRITYSKTNDAALRAILDCKYAMVASGGEAAQYIVLGGNDAQPDAIFWNANDELAIQPWYFPMPCYNLVGTAGDPVTGFGRQYDDTLVFSDHTVGKLTYGTQEIDGRLYPAFGYARVNSKIGCDLPWTIQQVENNVVFCNTYTGAHIVLSSSAAYENNIEQLSTKINEPRHEATGEIPGLLADIAASTTDVVSFDDDERYWICANGKVYVWDYEISTYAKPSWLYWENIYPAALFRDDQHNPYHLGHDGYITAYLPGLLSDDVLDDGEIVQEAIEKVYRFPTLHFGSYDRLKDVVRLLLAVRSDVPSTIRVWYETDYEKREDQTPVVVQPINAPGQSNLHVQVARRNPGCRHVRQFSLTLTNDVPGEELALVSAEVYHRFTGPER